MNIYHGFKCVEIVCTRYAWEFHRVYESSSCFGVVDMLKNEGDRRGQSSMEVQALMTFVSFDLAD